MGYWQDKNVLVTGATGFIGGHLAEALAARGSNLVTLVRDDVPASYFALQQVRATQVYGDLSDLPLLERVLNEYEITHVFHLAAQSQVLAANRNPVGVFRANIEGTWNLLEAARRTKGITRVVVASSDKAYGNSDELPYKETTPLRGVYPYDASKSCADLIAQCYHHTYRLPVNIIRSGNTYGPGDWNWARLIPGTIRRVLSGERPVARGGGKIKRDYLYVADAVEAYLLAARHETSGEAFNTGTGKPTTIINVINEILRLMDSEVTPWVLEDAPGELADQWLDSWKGYNDLGWEPKVGLTEGLTNTIEWYKKQIGTGNVTRCKLSA
jgi:CDP-glucose 4,6-dehydratase